MKRILVILRHSIAEDQNENISDFERHLTKEGRELSIERGLILKNEIQEIDLLLSSPALRTKETAEILADLFKINRKEIVYNEIFYRAKSVEDIIDTLLIALDEEHKNVLYCGHNPLISYLVSQFTDGYISLSKAGLVVFSEEAEDWKSFLRLKSIKPFLVSN